MKAYTLQEYRKARCGIASLLDDNVAEELVKLAEGKVCDGCTYREFDVCEPGRILCQEPQQ